MWRKWVRTATCVGYGRKARRKENTRNTKMEAGG
jgi:hypothetical protein